ncbi:MAG TPA: ABC transporter permease, partial [Terriglobales bacterium]|nr:ABC transporter permease [Terriglobales bacterium]
MKHYLVQRLLLFVPTLLGALTLVFLLIHFIPGDPVEVMLGETARAADKAELRRQLGLDQPLLSQYARFLGALAQGNLGSSLYHGAGVSVLILSHFPATMELTAYALTMALLLSFPLGIVAAAKPGSWIDRSALLFSMLGLSMPNFWLGPLLMITVSIHLGWLPVAGRGSPAH